MGSALLERLTPEGQIAFVIASVLLAAYGMLLMLWHPRHSTYRSHDCRRSGCRWLEDKPRP